MITYTDIAKSVTTVLNNAFPNIPVYADDVTEGYKTPCFFIGLYPVSSTTETVNISSTTLLIVVSYFADTKNSIVNLNTMQQIKKVFGITLNVGNRKLLISNSETEKVNDDGDVFDFSFSITYKEVHNDTTTSVPTATTLNTRVNTN